MQNQIMMKKTQTQLQMQIHVQAVHSGLYNLGCALRALQSGLGQEAEQRKYEPPSASAVWVKRDDCPRVVRADTP
eukprot:12431502-Karenia_brevis.AAC.2